jgi:hypothetical protein
MEEDKGGTQAHQNLEWLEGVCVWRVWSKKLEKARRLPVKSLRLEVAKLGETCA